MTDTGTSFKYLPHSREEGESSVKSSLFTITMGIDAVLIPKRGTF